MSPVTEPPQRIQLFPPRAPSLADVPSIPSPHSPPQAVSTKEKELNSFEPFADASKCDDLLPAGTKDYIHIKNSTEKQQKETTVQGITDDHHKKKLVKAFKKKFACSDTVTEHLEYEEVIQLQGDQSKNICKCLIAIGLAKDDQQSFMGFKYL